jgi:hypothetical protein
MCIPQQSDNLNRRDRYFQYTAKMQPAQGLQAAPARPGPAAGPVPTRTADGQRHRVLMDRPQIAACWSGQQRRR